MKRLFLFLGISAAACAFADEAPYADGISATPDVDNRFVAVSYTLHNGPAIVTLDVQTNVAGDVWASIGGENFRSVQGDINKLVAASDSPYSFRWNSGLDWPGRTLAADKIRFVVSAWTKSAPPDFMVMNLTASNSVSFYAVKEAIPLGMESPLNKTACLVMRKIPAAKVRWRMGTATGARARNDCGATPPHYVTFTEDYYMGVYKFTQGQLRNLVDTTGITVSGISVARNKLEHPILCTSFGNFRGGGSKGTESPYIWTVNGHDVSPTSPLGALRGMNGLGIKFDYPTEAQWEYACRAGTTTRWYTGENNSYSIAWTKQHTWPDGSDTSHPVGELIPNGWDLYDMCGNGSEWCLDWWDPDGTSMQTDQTDPEGLAFDATNTQHATRSAATSWDENFGGADGRYRSGSSGGVRVVCPAPIP